jgi:aspartyl-tRNA(Asn)/glutamyl-tRNA(Gln) amidotransferase subunit C
MTHLSRDEVVELARLARIDLHDDIIERLRGELGAVLEYVAMLGEVDVTGVEPMTHAVAMTLRLREDVAQPPLSLEDALGGAAVVRDDCFEVPAVIRE